MKTAICILFFLMLASFSNAQEVKQVNKDQLSELMKSLEGKPVLVNLWATWCRPCVEEFPELMRIKNDYSDKQLQVVLISLDFGDDAMQRVTDFLKKNNVDFVTYINAFEKDEELIDFFDKNWNGGIPATFIYDNDGDLKASMVGKRTYDAFSKELEKVYN